MQRAWALALVCAPACAAGVSLEGSESGDTPAATSMVGTGSTPTGETTAPDPSTSEDPTAAQDSTSTGETTEGVEDSSSGEDSTSTGPELPHAELYPYDRVHSPITQFVAERMRAIAPVPGTIDARFAKVGGTTTASANFMQCLADPDAIMDLPAELMTTRDYFLAEIEPGVSSYTRASTAATAAWSSADLSFGQVAGEMMAILPRFALLLVGTHDLASDQPASIYTFGENLLDIVDEVIVGGGVPILSTLPQRSDMPTKVEWVPRYNAVIRAVAQGRQVPLVDLELALRSVALSGLGPDGIDLSAYISAAEDRPCFFNEVGLMNGGYNVRNRESLVALDRARAVVIDQAPGLDDPQPGLRGAGTLDDPFVIPSLPFVDLRTTVDGPSDEIDSYSGACDSTKDESGPEVVYSLETDTLVNLRVMVIDRASADVDVHVLDSPDPTTCLKRNDKEITGPLPEGDYTIVVDSYAGEVSGGAAGEYVLVVLAD